MAKIVYNYDQEGYYIGNQEAALDPLETKIKKQNAYLLPSNATFTKMDLKPQENKRIKWNSEKWIYEDIPITEDEKIKTDEEITDQLKNEAVAIRKGYLYSTDWYILREYDQPNSYPAEIKNQRILARKQVNEIEKIDNLTDAQNIEKDYEFIVNNNQQ